MAAGGTLAVVDTVLSGQVSELNFISLPARVLFGLA